jgi:Tfp pilus assembly protein PilF/predicted AlkP superfamily phosphohydrolase/phosphomutase
VDGPGTVFDRRVDDGIAFAPAGLFSISRYPRQPIELPLPQAEQAWLASNDGSRYGFRGRATLLVRPEQWRELLAASGGGGLQELLLQAVRESAEQLPEGMEGGRATEPLLIGLDGADWTLIDERIAAGEMPNMNRLVQQGTRGKLLSISPMLSPVIWTSLATGVEPARHGILDFLVEDPEGGSAQPVTSVQRTAPTFWELLSRRGLHCGVIGWWASWPADPIEGYMITDRIGYQLFGYQDERDDPVGKTWPPELYSSIRPLIREADDIPWLEVEPYLDGSRKPPEDFDEDEQKMLAEFRTLLASGQSYLEIAKKLGKEQSPDLEIVYFEGTDTIGHLFMPYRPPARRGVDPDRSAAFGSAVNRYYRTIDGMLGRLLEDHGDEWTIMIVSDHGFASDETRPQWTDSRIGHGAAADWHRRFGVVLLAGAGVRPGGTLGEASIYDIAPTVMAMYGQPVPRSWPGRVLASAFEPDYFDGAPVRFVDVDPVRRLESDVSAVAVRDPASEALVEKLRTLGYVGGESGSSAASTAGNNAAVSMLSEGRFKEAEEAFREVLEGTPDQPTMMVNLAIALQGQGRDEEARELLNDAFQYVATRRSAGHLLARIDMDKGDLDAAEKRLRLLVRGEPGAADVRTTLAELLEQRGKMTEAEEQYRRAAEVDDSLAKPRNQLGNMARQRGDAESAERWYRAAIDADPYFMGAYNNLALVYQDRGEMDRAVELYSEALTRAPRNAVVLNNLASLYFARGEIDEAASLWSRASRVDPSYASPWNNLGGIDMQSGRWNQARQKLDRALVLDPEYGDARLNRAIVERQAGDLDAAREDLQGAIDDPRTRRRALAEWAALEFEQGLCGQAIPMLEELHQAGTAETGLLNMLGECYRRADREADTLRIWKESLQIAPQPTLEKMIRELTAELKSG